MPRKPRNDASPRGRVVPKTSGIVATGTCGHEFSHRYPVPAPLVGKPFEGAALEAFLRWREHTAQVMGCADCLDCRASEILGKTRLTFAKWTEWLQVADVPALEPGTFKSLAFAESVRWGVVQERMLQSLRMTRELFNDRSTATHIIDAALRSQWPDEQWVDLAYNHAGSPAAYFLKERLPRDVLSPIGQLERGGAPQQALALWILSRATWPNEDHILFTERRGSAWIALKRSRRLGPGHQVHDVGSRVDADVVACRIVVQLGHWKDPMEAWDFFTALRDVRVAEMVGVAFSEPRSHSLLNLVQMGSSMAAISGLSNDAIVDASKASRILGTA